MIDVTDNNSKNKAHRSLMTCLKAKKAEDIKVHDAISFISTVEASCDLPLLVTLRYHMLCPLALILYGYQSSSNRWPNNSKLYMQTCNKHRRMAEGGDGVGESHKRLPWQQLPCVSVWVGAGRETWDAPPETASNTGEPTLMIMPKPNKPETNQICTIMNNMQITLFVCFFKSEFISVHEHVH